MSKADEILEILDERIESYETQLRRTSMDHPLVDERATYLRSLKEFKVVLMNRGIIQRAF